MRIALLTQRNQRGGRIPAYAGLSEAEDVLCSCVEVSMFDLASQVTDRTTKLRRLAGGAVRRRNGSFLLPPAPGRGSESFDLVIAVLTTIWELPLLEAHPMVRSADRVIVWIPEVWSNEFDDQRLAFEPYGVAANIFVGTTRAPAILSSLIDRDVQYLTWAVDVDRFRPTSISADRQIDVLNIGRRIEALHELLLPWSERTNRMYEYDSFVGARVVDPTSHRRRLAGQYKRSSVAVTSYPKHDLPGHDSHLDIPARLWEGLGAGTIMIGRATMPSVQEDVVGAVVVRELPREPREALVAVEELLHSDLGCERRRNVAMALRGHDWSHRWATLFRESGLGVPAGVAARIERLRALAAEISPED